jgi:hypothetical protein
MPGLTSIPSQPGGRKSLFSFHDTRSPPRHSVISFTGKKYNVTFDLRRGQRRRRKLANIFGVRKKKDVQNL